MGFSWQWIHFALIHSQITKSTLYSHPFHSPTPSPWEENMWKTYYWNDWITYTIVDYVHIYVHMEDVFNSMIYNNTSTQYCDLATKERWMMIGSRTNNMTMFNESIKMSLNWEDSSNTHHSNIIDTSCVYVSDTDILQPLINNQFDFKYFEISHLSAPLCGEYDVVNF